jgi:transcriptional regulator with XRE-family HTH domain
MNDKMLGQRIRAIRATRGLTLEQCARVMGTSKATLSAIENGKRQIRITQLNAIAAALGTDINEILTTSNLPA